MVPPESSCHKEHSGMPKYESPMSNGMKVRYRVKIFQMKVNGHGQGQAMKIDGTIGKVL